MIDPIGVFDVGGLPIEVTPDGEGWSVRFAGVPEGFEPALTRRDETSFEVERGPLSGAVLTFEDADTGHLGPMPVVRLESDYEEPPGYGLRPPRETTDPDRDRAFADLLDRTAQGGRILFDVPYPKHEFVRWAQSLDRFIFHSSTNTAIEEFQPKRDSMELGDHGERGNLGAVYGTHDAYWSMFFGIVDRQRLRGSMRNGVFEWETRDGSTTTTYQFSLEAQSLDGRPFTDGAVYLLPRDTFQRLPHYPGGPISHEWASQHPVRPVASLLIIPSDFPFLDEIAGHDETDFLAMLEHFREIVEGVTRYRADNGSGLAITLDWSEQAQRSYQEWAARAKRHMPIVDHRLEGDEATRILHLDGPEPYLNAVRERLDEILSRPVR